MNYFEEGPNTSNSVFIELAPMMPLNRNTVYIYCLGLKTTSIVLDQRTKLCPMSNCGWVFLQVLFYRRAKSCRILHEFSRIHTETIINGIADPLALYVEILKSFFFRRGWIKRGSNQNGPWKKVGIGWQFLRMRKDTALPSKVKFLSFAFTKIYNSFTPWIKLDFKTGAYILSST